MGGERGQVRLRGGASKQTAALETGVARLSFLTKQFPPLQPTRGKRNVRLWSERQQIIVCREAQDFVTFFDCGWSLSSHGEADCILHADYILISPHSESLPHLSRVNIERKYIEFIMESTWIVDREIARMIT
jgi:hypothetical protein